FDLAFHHFFGQHAASRYGEPNSSAAPYVQHSPRFIRGTGSAAPSSTEQDRSNLNQDDDADPTATIQQTYSAIEKLRRKDFAEMTATELDAVKTLMTQYKWQLGRRRSRRFQSGGRQTPDIRRSLRRNLRHGGEWLKWSYRKPKSKPRPLIILADISGSMERYARLLLHFVFGLQMGTVQTVEVFVFSTRLTRISRYLNQRNVKQAMSQVARAVPDWSGGTRIGESLRRFNHEWGRRVLNRGAVVLLISDGWDRGDPALLAREMAHLQRSCHRLIWLNPLLGLARYEPLTRGMQAALPFVDDFLPVHNLASLDELANHLANLQLARAPFARTVGKRIPSSRPRP
ncbi:MAG: VWA domain-containing protein, partial [Candidatus Promineifilaceae bacterium]|nr:VWA domain-containing protein [Candidatus Promineifilaceae bacterium]